MDEYSSIEQVYNLFFKDYPDVLDVTHLKEILNVSDKTILYLLQTNEIHSIKVGRSYRIPKLFLMKYLKMIPCV